MKGSTQFMLFMLSSSIVWGALIAVVPGTGSMETSRNGSTIATSDWTPPAVDNTYYMEDLSMQVLRDGSLVSAWSLVDNGKGKITFPVPLDVPFNLSDASLLDLRVRFAANQRGTLPQSWGPFTNQEINYEFAYDARESIMSHLFLEYYFRVDDSTNITRVAEKVVNYTRAIEGLWPGVKFFTFDEFDNSGGSGQRMVTIQQYAFPDAALLRTIFEDIMADCLPLGEGLFRPELNAFLDASHKSIHVAANWDNSYSDAYAQEPWIDGSTEQQDHRWEYMAGIVQHKERAITINDALTTLYFKDVVPYTSDLPSNPVANSSQIVLNLFHGAQIIGTRPNFDVPRMVSRYELDMLQDSGEGASYQLPLNAHVNFTATNTPTPVVTIETSLDNYVVSNGENITITHTVTNKGTKTAYDVSIVDNFNAWLGSFSILSGDSNADGQIDATWATIAPGVTVTHVAVIQCISAVEAFAMTSPILNYHASTYADTSEWLRNPTDPYNGYMFVGETIFFACNSITPVIDLSVDVSSNEATVGDELNVTMIVKNGGNANATNVRWGLPILGANSTLRSGTFDVILPGEQKTVSGLYKVDVPSRFSGLFIENRFYMYYFSGFASFSFTPWPTAIAYSTSLPLNVFPSTDRSFGPLLMAWRETSTVSINGEDLIQVTNHVRNAGDLPAYQIDVTDALPLDNFTVIAGTNNFPSTYAILFPGMEFSYSYILKNPVGFDVSRKANILVVTYQTTHIGFFTPYSITSDGVHAIPVPIQGIDPAMFWGITIAMIAAVAVAVVLLLMLLEEKGTIHAFKR